jgi:hypothetical protein
MGGMVREAQARGALHAFGTCLLGLLLRRLLLRVSLLLLRVRLVLDVRLRMDEEGATMRSP